MRNYIKKHREEADLTREQLGEMIGVSKSTISNWERDLTDPTPTQRQDVAMALGVSMSDVFPRFRIDTGTSPSAGKKTLESYDTLRLNSRVNVGDRMLVKLVNVSDFGQTFVPGKVVQCTPYWFRVQLNKTGSSVCFTYQEFLTDSAIRRAK